MKPSLQQIALAELAGYVWYWVYDLWDSTNVCPIWKAVLRFRPEDGIENQAWIGTCSETRHMTEAEIDAAKESGQFTSTAPDYLSDLNALAALRRHLYATAGYANLCYSHELSTAMNGRPAWVSFDVTAAEHAEATLRMVGKWEETS